VALYGSWHGINRVVDSLKDYSIETDYQRLGALGGCDVLRLVINTTRDAVRRLDSLTEKQEVAYGTAKYPATVPPYTLDQVALMLYLQGWRYGNPAV
jgi:hypothetical protein